MLTKKWSEWRTWENWKEIASQQIEARGLTKNLEEIEAQGFTVISLEQMGDPRLFEQTKEALLRVGEEITGVRPNEETGEHGFTDCTGTTQTQNHYHGILEKDPNFEVIIQHPLTLPLIDYYLGPGCLLSNLGGIVKWQDPVGYGDTITSYGGLNADTYLYPFEPLPDAPMVFNTNWCLSDYTKDNRALAVVPGSHKLRRHPKPGEGGGSGHRCRSARGFGHCFPWHSLARGLAPDQSRFTNVCHCLLQCLLLPHARALPQPDFGRKSGSQW